MEVKPSDHRKPLYLMATINGVQVKRALVDMGVSVNLITLSTLEVVGLTSRRILGAPIEITGFGGSAESTEGYVQLALRVGPIVALTIFHVINSKVSYHVLLGRPWLHKYRFIPSTYHQCIKGRLNGRPIRIPANLNPFSQGEVNFVETMFYDKLEPNNESPTLGTLRAPVLEEEEEEEEEDGGNAYDLRDLLDKKRQKKETSSSRSREWSADSTGKGTAGSLTQEICGCIRMTYDEMPGLDPKLVVHSLNVDPGVKPAIQPARVFHTDTEAQITQEVKKLLATAFIKPIQHLKWLSNIVPIKKKNGQIQCCVDFRNLNKACPKDEFPLPNVDLCVDSGVGNSMFSFMDGYNGYSQICMAAKDAKKTAFRTPIENFHYIMMPFGLKNAGATYQQTMIAIFHDIVHKEMENYVDNIVVK
ncbi:uncharacterized protein LOC142616303 [Castanea sativa]|uniref:uncharacterized protein LOC142616303 n=1 Tax=Castanea sativa TaxID=21020 RepID=UPI003F64986F